MSKAILEFNFPEDECEFRIAVKAMNWALAVWDIEQYLREKLKHGGLNEQQSEAYGSIRDELHNIFDTRYLNLEEID